LIDLSWSSKKHHAGGFVPTQHDRPTIEQGQYYPLPLRNYRDQIDLSNMPRDSNLIFGEDIEAWVNLPLGPTLLSPWVAANMYLGVYANIQSVWDSVSSLTGSIEEYQAMPQLQMNQIDQ